MDCERVKEFLSQRGHAFVVRMVEEDDAAYDELLQLGFRSVPVTIVGTVAVKGYDTAALIRALEDGG